MASNCLFWASSTSRAAARTNMPRLNHEFTELSILKWDGTLATNLHRLGVPDETIQRILRHSTVAVTQNCYIKTADADAVAAMRSLENAPNMHLGSVKRPSMV